MPQRKTDETFLSRWSRRKLEAARAQPQTPQSPVAEVTPGDGAVVEAPAPAAPTPVPTAGSAAELPPVESLTFESDFRVFMQPGVDPDVQRAALRKLLHDPRFNVMDGLDVYIDDYTKLAPLPADMVRKLAHARYLFSPPRTRVNAEGIVEDVPDAADAQETQASLAAPQAASSSETFTAPAGAAAAPLDAPTVESKPNS